MAKYKFLCRSCGVSLRVAEPAFGRTVACPSCGEHTIVPTPEEEAARKEELQRKDEQARQAKAKTAQERKGNTHRPTRGEPSPSKNATVVVLVLCGVLLGVIVGAYIMRDAAPASPDGKTKTPHKFAASSRPRGGRDQIRAVVPLGQYTEAEFRSAAVRLATKHRSAFALVQFFDDKKALAGWDGTGSLRNADWPHWLCRTSVDTDSSGRRYARTFRLGVNESTGQARTDVLRVE